MILVDTGPLVALFNRKDRSHPRCREVLQSLREPLVTTVPVLTEVFHMLSPGSRGADALRDFVASGGVTALATTKIFTIDRDDFLTYRVRRGHRLVRMEIVG